MDFDGDDVRCCWVNGIECMLICEGLLYVIIDYVSFYFKRVVIYYVLIVLEFVIDRL